MRKHDSAFDSKQYTSAGALSSAIRQRTVVMKCTSAAPDLSEDDVYREALVNQSRSAFEQGITVCGQEALRGILFSINVTALLASKYRDTRM